MSRGPRAEGGPERVRKRERERETETERERQTETERFDHIEGKIPTSEMIGNEHTIFEK